MANSTTQYNLPDGRRALDVTEAKVLTNAQCGIVQNVVTDAITITLPATVSGESYIIRNGGDPAANTPDRSASDGSCLVTVSPNSADLINGLAFTAADDKDALNTKATSKIGDEIHLIGNGGDGWNIASCKRRYCLLTRRSANNNY